MTDPNLRPGAIVELNDGRIGTIRFVGETTFRPGKWVGVELEDPSGKNDGSVQGKRYFDCEDGYGMFLQPSGVGRIIEAAPAPAPAPKPATARRPSATPATAKPNGKAAVPAPKGRTASVASATASRPASRPSSIASESQSRTSSPIKRPATSTTSKRTSMAPPASRRISNVPSSASPAPSSNRLSARPASSSTPPVHARPTSTISTTARPSANRPSISPAKKPSPVSQPSNRGPSTAVSVSTVTSRSGAVHSKEIEELQAKLKILEKKRLEDREKLSSMERAEQDRDKYKSIIEKLQTKYQPQQQENAELKKQLKEAEAALEQIEHIQAEHDSVMEMATLDREMAEEQAEAYKTELEALKPRLEELELENEILKEEAEELSKDMSPEERTSQGWLQMERENERLRQALLRLRDITQDNETELKEKIESLEEDVQELGTIKHDYDDTKAKLLECEADIEDLRQQLDAALGAEEIIEELTERNLALSEQIEELKGTVEDLQDLKELNDELEYNHIENEKQLQEVVDFKDSLLAEQSRRSAQQEEALIDQEYTISRFRELVTNMQADLEELRASKEMTETETQELNEKSKAMFDLNRQLQASTASNMIRTIDMELRKLEAQEAAEHLSIVQLFLPEAFQSERESVLALLRFKRVFFKANLLLGSIRDRISKGGEHAQDDIFSACDVLDKLTWVAAMCERFINHISGCSLDQFAKFSGALYELEPVERYLNRCIENLKRDSLKEKEVSEELHRSMAIMSDLAEHHLGSDPSSYADDILMRALLMQSHMDTTASALSAMKEEISIKMGPASDGDAEDEFARYIQQAETAISASRSAKVVIGKAVRSLQELKARNLTLNRDSDKEFNDALLGAEEIAEYSRKLGENVYAIVREEGRTEPVTFSSIKSAAVGTANAVFSTKQQAVTESEPFSTMRTRFKSLAPTLIELQAFCADLDNTYEFDQPVPPWVLRSKELAAAKIVSVDAEDEIRRLKEEIQAGKRELRTKLQDLGERDVKIEVLEKRVGDAAKKTAKIKELEIATQEHMQAISNLQQNVQEKTKDLGRLMDERDRAVAAAEDYRKRTGETSSKKGDIELSGVSSREVERLKDEVLVLERTNKYLRQANQREIRARDSAADSWLHTPLLPTTDSAIDEHGSTPRSALADLTNLPSMARLVDLQSLLQDPEGVVGKNKKQRLQWKPKKLTPQYMLEEQEGRWAEIWGGWDIARFGSVSVLG